MDEESKALIESVVHEAAAPYRKVMGAILGIAFLDALEEKREDKRRRRLENRKNIARETVLRLTDKDVELDPEDVIPEYVEKIMEAGEETSVPELQQLFARLLASALDPKKRKIFRLEFIDLVKQFEPIDALVLKALSTIETHQWAGEISKGIKHSNDEVFVSGENLSRLGLMEPRLDHKSILQSGHITARGRQLLACIDE